MSCEIRRDLITQLVAGGLDPGEHAELRAHLETGCTICAQSLVEAQQLAFALSLSPDPVEPSANAKYKLRERLGPAVQAEPRRSAIRRTASPYPAPLVSGLSAIAAGIVVALFFGLRNGPIVEERNMLRDELAEVQSLQTELGTELAELRSELETADDELAELEAAIRALEADAVISTRQIEMLRSPNVVVMSILGTPRQPKARARAFWGEDYYCYLSAKNLRRLAEGRAYALWLDTENDGVILAGSFVTDQGGTGTMWVPLGQDLGHISRAFVTEEAKDDIRQEPTGPVELQSPAEV